MNNDKWITAPSDTGFASAEFRRSFRASGKVKKAYLYACAMGLYFAELNGRRVGSRVLTPGFTSYRNRIQYQEYDITDMLGQDNSVNIVAGPGWAVGTLGFKHDYHVFADRVSVIAEIVIEYADGKTESIVTDETWDTYTSQIRFSDIYNGETFDSTYVPEFLGKAVHSEVNTKLIPDEGEPIVENERLEAVRVFTAPNGERIVDFGQNMTGYVEFRLRGKRGERIRISHAEVLDKGGNFYNGNYRSARNEITYVLDGTQQILKPRFSFQGFRYIRLDEYPDIPVKTSEICAVAVHSDIKRRSYFVCGNEKINQLYHNAIWGQKSNYLDIPTDCPQRDERLGWTGDAQVFCRTAAMNFNVDKFFKKWLGDMRAEQREDGAIAGVVPEFRLDGKPSSRISAAWGDASVIIPWELYEEYGDKSILEDNFEMMRNWVEYMHSAGSEEFLWLEGDHYGDWLAMDAGEDSLSGATSPDLIASTFFAYSTELLIKAGEVLGKDMSEYRTLYKNVVSAFREKYMENGMPKEYIPSTNTSRKHDAFSGMTQTAIILILHFGLCLPEEREALAQKLEELIHGFDDRMSTGFVGTPYILHTLSENGRTELAYELLTEERNPSWLYSVMHGATTIWEHWNGIKENGEFWSDSMNSFNHYAYGSVFDWVFGVACGVKVSEDGAGYKKFSIEPHPSRKLGFADFRIDTAYGTVVSKWYYRDDDIHFEFTVPAGTEAALTLPDGTKHTLTGGSYLFTVKA